MRKSILSAATGPWAQTTCGVASSIKDDFVIKIKRGKLVIAEVPYFQVGKKFNAYKTTTLITAAPDLLTALTRLSFAAMARDNTMGDQCALFAAQAELRDANKQATEVIAKATGATR